VTIAPDTFPADLRAITLRNDQLEVVVLAGKGADIYSLIDRRTGIDVLFKSPWGIRASGAWARATTSIETWVESYAGGWQLLLPNGGDECQQRGVTWGYHGEAALVPWTVLDQSEASATLETRLMSVPLHVVRELTLSGSVLRVRETVTNESDEEVEVMWSHHPAFGAPFLDEHCVVAAGCRTVLADDRAPGTLLAAGSRHEWPVVVSVAGDTVDLRSIPSSSEPRAVFGYLFDFDQGFFSITNPTLGLGVGLRWPLDIFDKAWLWEEMNSTPDWPWFRRAYVLAIEPASTMPGQGMENARAKGQSGVILGARCSREVVLEMVLFEGSDVVAGIDEGGTVRFVAA